MKVTQGRQMHTPFELLPRCLTVWSHDTHQHGQCTSLRRAICVTHPHISVPPGAEFHSVLAELNQILRTTCTNLDFEAKKRGARLQICRCNAMINCNWLWMAILNDNWRATSTQSNWKHRTKCLLCTTAASGQKNCRYHQPCCLATPGPWQCSS